MKTRTATPSDIPSIAALLEDNRLMEADWRDRFGESYVVLEDQGGVVGVAGMETYGDLGLLRSVAVAPERHGQGLGRRLVEDRLAWARQQGFRAVYLLTEGADAFFARFGFRPIARSEVAPEIQESGQFATHCPDSATVMILELPPTRSDH